LVSSPKAPPAARYPDRALFGPDGTWLLTHFGIALTAGPNVPNYRLWVLDGSGPPRTFLENAGTDSGFESRLSPDARLLLTVWQRFGAVGENLVGENLPAVVEARALPAAERVWARECRGLRGNLAVSPDGSLLTLDGDDGTVRLWAVADGREYFRWEP